MNSPTAAPDIRKLAHLLGTTASDLRFLSMLDRADARALRRQLADTLFEADRPLFARVVAASRLVPVAVSARITERAIPPLMSARMVELVDSARAMEMVRRLSDGYLADVSAAMDPDRSPDLIRQLPLDRVTVVAAELARREEWVVMSGFVAWVSPAALRAAVSVLDGGQLLQIGYVLDDDARLGEITGLFTDQQLDEVLAAAATQPLWTELDGVLGRLGDTDRARLAARVDAGFAAAARTAAAAGRLSADALEALAG
jgi:hypothetical protein